jgi:cytoskeletal protein CcmA (bactofilin family)
MKPAEGSTIIGKSVTIRGDLTGKEDLYMDGDIEGTITLHESALTVGENARVIADVHARDIIVLGKVSGNLHASGRVELRHTAAVLGDIFAARLSIEDNAALKGRVELKATDTRARDFDASAAVPSQETFVLESKA